MQTFSLGYSPCPNDTYIFHGLVHGLVPLTGWRPEPVILEDVETLNSWALAGKLDITKLSFHALGHVLDEYVLLQSGAALGRGCGPLLVAARPLDGKDLASLRLAVPGRYTTAAMLLKLFAPESALPSTMRFDRIMPAICSGEVDAGVIIHESRFTYRQHGLVLIQDLGEWWERITGHPIPLGGIAVRRSLGSRMIEQVDQAIRASVRRAFRQPAEAAPYVRRHARELDGTVIARHIELYVNSYSENLGPEGSEAARFFLEKGREVGLLPPFSGALTSRTD